jgi:recombinational DNA repair ATPase RecF
MTKSLTAYYGLLATAVLAQVLITVFSLSQNIGYGQKISFLENKKTEIMTTKSQLSQELAKKVAINELEQTENSDYVAIAEVVLIERNSENLASR